MGFPGDAAAYAYAWALANMEYIVRADGMGDVERILERIGSGTSTEAALREVLHGDYGDVMRSTAEFLRKITGDNSRPQYIFKKLGLAGRK